MRACPLEILWLSWLIFGNRVNQSFDKFERLNWQEKELLNRNSYRLIVKNKQIIIFHHENIFSNNNLIFIIIHPPHSNTYSGYAPNKQLTIPITITTGKNIHPIHFNTHLSLYVIKCALTIDIPITNTTAKPKTKTKTYQTIKPNTPTVNGKERRHFMNVFINKTIHFLPFFSPSYSPSLF